MTEELIKKLLPYLDHLPTCDALQVNWHKGPCNCGFEVLQKQIPPALYEEALKMRQAINRAMYGRNS